MRMKSKARNGLWHIYINLTYYRGKADGYNAQIGQTYTAMYVKKN